MFHEGDGLGSPSYKFVAIGNIRYRRGDAIPLQPVVLVVEEAREVLIFELGKLPGEGQHALAQVGIVRVLGAADERFEGGFEFALGEQGFQILIRGWHRRLIVWRK